MKRSLVVLSSLALLGSGSLAADNSWFVGAEFGGMHVKSKLKASGGSASVSEKGTINSLYESIKVGKYFDYGRVYGNFDLQNKKKDVSSYSFGLGYDYIFDVNFPFAPFVGVNAGYTKAKIKDDDFKTLGIDKPDGFYYGAGLGVIYEVDKNLEVEFGARYMGANIKEKNTVKNIELKAESKYLAQYYVGLNYRF